MPRDIPVGNNKFLICFDKDYVIRDIYFPHVGQENHANGNRFLFRSGVVHYKASRYFLVNGYSEFLNRLSQFAVGVKKTGGKEGTFKDAEDGVLSGNPIAQGSVDSVVSVRIEVEGMRSPGWINPMTVRDR